MSSTPEAPKPAPGANHAETARGELDRALALVRFLRANCPWDAAQTAESLVPHLIEEAQEVVDAIHRNHANELEGELGDLLLNLAFQIVVAEERAQLSAESVMQRLERKMRRRHPHLYGDGPKEAWEAIKARERAEEAAGGGAGPGPKGADDRSLSLLDGLASSLDPLTRAHRMQQRVAQVGFEWEDWRGALDKVVEELDEVRVELDAQAAAERAAGVAGGEAGAAEGEGRRALDEELGDLLFAVVNLVRLAGSHPVAMLNGANHKFERRFRMLEQLAQARGVTFGEAGLDELDALWDEVKAAEKAAIRQDPPWR